MSSVSSIVPVGITNAWTKKTGSVVRAEIVIHGQATPFRKPAAVIDRPAKKNRGISTAARAVAPMVPGGRLPERNTTSATGNSCAHMKSESPEEAYAGADP